MNIVFSIVALLVFVGDGIRTEQNPKTQLYVKTVPPGATVFIDGKEAGKSDGLFPISTGVHGLAVRLHGYQEEQRSIEVAEGEITRVEVKLRKRSGCETTLGYVKDESEAKQSFADSGHAVAFQRPADMKSIVAVKLFASRYGYPNPPNEDFHVYLLDENQKVLEHMAIPYGRIERGAMKWHTLSFPAVEVPEKFMVAVWFNAEATKGVYLGKDTSVSETHSYIGLPDKGLRKADSSYDWMIRAVVDSDPGRKPTHPKVTTYGAEKAADTESAEAMPSRTWNDSAGAFSVDAQFTGVKDGKVMLKKSDGKIISVPLDRLSKKDRDFVASQLNASKKKAKSAATEKRDLSHDNGTAAGKSSIAGGGHAVRFSVDGDSWCVTSLSLHGSRYGEKRPPKEDFNVWICDNQFNPIATFKFSYSSFIRGNPAWKSFCIRPTRVPKDFIVCFGFNPHQTKGVYVSYDDQKSANSLIGVPNQSQPKPFGKGNWLIRCKVEKREESDK